MKSKVQTAVAKTVPFQTTIPNELAEFLDAKAKEVGVPVEEIVKAILAMKVEQANGESNKPKSFGEWIQEIPPLQEFNADTPASVTLKLGVQAWLQLAHAAAVNRCTIGEAASFVIDDGEFLCDWESEGFRPDLGRSNSPKATEAPTAG